MKFLTVSISLQSSCFDRTRYPIGDWECKSRRNFWGGKGWRATFVRSERNGVAFGGAGCLESGTYLADIFSGALANGLGAKKW